MGVAENLEAVRDQIHRAAAAAGRKDEITVVAVSKTMGPDRVKEAYDAGQRVFGENRVQEGAAKIAYLAAQMPGCSWHLIGTLQSNKARRAAEAFSVIESVDSIRLARRLSEAAGDIARVLPILLEVNVAGEASKSGFSPDDVRRDMPELMQLPHLALNGLMTVAPLSMNPETVRPVFRSLRALRDEIRDSLPLTGFDQLSMGMSNDFIVAIEEGATMVRIGRAIFGERPL